MSLDNRVPETEKIKEVLTPNLFLTHYNPKQEIIVTSDASSFDIGACIRHKFDEGSIKRTAYASRTLFPAEKNYYQI